MIGKIYIASVMVVLLVMSGLFLRQAQKLTASLGRCEAAFEDVQHFTTNVFAGTTSEIINGVIAWDSADWDNIVRRIVSSSESFLNYCAIVNQPLSEQPELVGQLAELSLMQSLINSLDVGGDFGDVVLSSNFTPTTEFIDLNGDDIEELVLHTQVPYFSQDTVYQIRGGLSIAFFFGEDGWRGQVIVPVTHFVTNEIPEHLTYTMSENHNLNVQASHEALVYFPLSHVQVLDVEDTRLTFITLYSSTGTGEAKELAVLTWNNTTPSVELRVAFDDWCYPGSALEWEILDDGSVFIPSNGGEEGSLLHCGRTPAVLFQWANGEYVPQL